MRKLMIVLLMITMTAVACGGGGSTGSAGSGGGDGSGSSDSNGGDDSNGSDDESSPSVSEPEGDSEEASPSAIADQAVANNSVEAAYNIASKALESSMLSLNSSPNAVVIGKAIGKVYGFDPNDEDFNTLAKSYKAGTSSANVSVNGAASGSCEGTIDIDSNDVVNFTLDTTLSCSDFSENAEMGVFNGTFTIHSSGTINLTNGSVYISTTYNSDMTCSLSESLYSVLYDLIYTTSGSLNLGQLLGTITGNVGDIEVACTILGNTVDCSDGSALDVAIYNGNWYGSFLRTDGTMDNVSVTLEDGELISMDYENLAVDTSTITGGALASANSLFRASYGCFTFEEDGSNFCVEFITNPKATRMFGVARLSDGVDAVIILDHNGTQTTFDADDIAGLWTGHEFLVDSEGRFAGLNAFSGVVDDLGNVYGISQYGYFSGTLPYYWTWIGANSGQVDGAPIVLMQNPAKDGFVGYFLNSYNFFYGIKQSY